MVAIEQTSIGAPGPGGNATSWRLERVSLAGQEPTRTLEFQADLNVVLSSVGSVDAVVTRLRSVLNGGDGTHVEFAVDDGPSFVLFRPFGARHRLIELESGQEHPLPTLAAFSFDAGATDLAALYADADTVRHLCRLEQTMLWDLAERALAERASASSPSEPGERPDHAGASSGADTEPGGLRRLLRRKPRPATASAATEPTGDTASAEATWWQLAGPVDIDTALCHRARIEAAAGLQGRIGAMAAVGSPDSGGVSTVDPIEIVRAVCALVPRSRPAGGPHIVAAPASIDHELLTFVLDYLAGLSGGRQVVVVTDDEAVADWARLESHARRTALLGFDLDAQPRRRPPGRP